MAAPDEPRYVPAAGRAVLTPIYDRAIALTMREGLWRGWLAAATLEGLAGGGVVVDVGCGTGTQAISLAKARPDLAVIGLDVDDQVLELARAKDCAHRVEFQHGRASSTGLADGIADRVLMTLLLHHLDPEAKRAALVEARRVLRPGGRLHIADWGKPSGPLTRAGFFALQLIDGFEGTRDHAGGRLPAFVAEGGFSHVTRTHGLRTVFGDLELLRAVA
jgi:ubiquinone/menaquinone biosynthesis C-methylase UbiE